MRNFVAVIFPNEARAYAGLRALQKLHGDGSITLYETVVTERQADGLMTSKFTSETPLRRTGLGALIGAVIGVVGGPVGAVFGATVGGFTGALGAAVRGTVGQNYADKIGKQLEPGTFAVLAEVHEDDTNLIDTCMSEQGGKVLRETRPHFFEEMLDKQAQTRRAELHDAELARASTRAERNELFLEADLEDARKKLRSSADAAREQLAQTRQELDRKIETLELQIEKAGPDVRKELNRRMIEIRDDLDERERKLSHALEIAREALRAPP